jgi:hypothetical protein
MRLVLFPVLVYLVLALVLTWPTALELGHTVPGGAHTDTWNSLWSLQHVTQAISNGRPIWFSNSLHFPDGGSFVVSDPLGAALVFPVSVLLGNTKAYSVLVWFQLMFTGWTMHMFATSFLYWRRGSGGAGWGPWISGVSLMVSPLMMSHVHNGATEALSAGWTVLAIWMAWRASVLRTTRAVLIAGVCLALASIAHWYGGVVAFVFAVALALWGNGEERGFRVAARWYVVVVGLLCTVPLASAFSNASTGADALVEIKAPEVVHQTTRTTGAADPIVYVHPGSHLSPNFREVSRNDERFMHVHYLGVFGLGFAIWGIVRRRNHATGFVLFAGASCLFLSMGPVLLHDARAVTFFGDLAIPLPFWLVEDLPGVRSLSLPWKLALGPMIAVALLAGVALDQRGTRWAMAALALLWIDARILSPASELPITLNVRPPAPLIGLAAAPDGAVINYPLQPGRPYLFEQTIHGKPLAGLLNQVANPQGMRLWRRIHAESKSSPDTFHRAVSSTAKRLGIRYLVIHPDPDAEPDVYSASVRKIEKLFPVPQWGRGQIRVVPLW